MLAGREHQRRNILEHRVFHADRRHKRAAPLYCCDIGNRLDPSRREVVGVEALMVSPQYRQLGVGGWIRNQKLKQESVELGLRERIRPFELNGILCGEYEENP